MFTPPYFREDSLETMHEIIRQQGFGLLISHGPNGIAATHLPFLLDSTRGEKGVLLGHVAKANDHWRHLGEADEVMAIFTGPHAYISPSWYTSRQNVPTWNYVAIHARGRARLLGDGAARDLLARLSSYYEAPLPNPWSVEEVPDADLQSQIKGIVGFELEITHLAGKKKLSQNRSPEDRSGVIQGLRVRGTPDGLAVAALMEGEER
jgi:transcriptional regulator